MSEPPVGLRVGELAGRLSVSPETLRAWERRYGVLRPQRTAGGYRIYGPADVARAERMRELIAEGHSAAQAARVIAPPESGPAPSAGELAARLLSTLLRYDAEAAHRTLDRLLAAHPVDVALRDAVLPVLREIGDGWERNEISVAQEHFAADLLAGRMRALARGWDRGGGPRAVLACPSGERHDLGLFACGLAMHERGWRITWLGADTPAPALRDTLERTRADAVVMGVLLTAALARSAEALATATGQTPLYIGGAGALEPVVGRAGGTRLADDPVTAAAKLPLPA
jgi:DNA-binding transcriptional MerR regulator